jgi:hypothetical protein
VYFSGPFQGITKFTGGKGGYIVIYRASLSDEEVELSPA